MEMRQLQIFTTAAREKNFSRAAEKLGYAQSNITIQIRSLEQQLGTRLFERLGKTVALTPAGVKLLEYAEQILKLAAEAQEAVAGFPEPRGTIRIGVLESLCVFRLPDFFKQYRQQYPQVKLILKLGTPLNFRNWLRDNTVDVAVSLECQVKEHDLAAKKLVPEPMVVIGEPAHRLVAKGRLEPRDIAEECLVFTEKGCSYRELMESHLAAHRIEPSSTLESDSVESIKQFVMSGLGIALLPRAAVVRELRLKRLADLNWAGPEINMFTQLMYHRDKWISPPLLSFINMLEDYFLRAALSVSPIDNRSGLKRYVLPGGKLRRT
ncbi:LysR family transcriptional regulator [Desulfocucumis palustris]|nr:LysR family transcriptional regulator [Desulfocucumis palustris]